MDLRKFTAIGRPVDPAYPTNLAILAITIFCVVAGSFYMVFAGEEMSSAIFFGLMAGMSVFFSWAICREIDPDNHFSAFVQIPFTLAGMIYFGAPNIVLLFSIMLLLRVVNRSVGLYCRMSDSIIVLIVASISSIFFSWVIGIAMAIAFLSDGILYKPLKRHLVFAVIGLGVTIYSVINGGPEGIVFADDSMRTFVFIFSGVVSLLFAGVILSSGIFLSKCDETEELIDPTRVKMAQILALFISATITIWSSEDGFVKIMPLWTALLGISLFRIYKMFKKTEKITSSDFNL